MYLNLGINENVLILEGIGAYLKNRIKAYMRDRLKILSRYKISSIEKFEKKVSKGSIPEHPGWEDLIIVENLENSISKLKNKKKCEKIKTKKISLFLLSCLYLFLNPWANI